MSTQAGIISKIKKNDLVLPIKFLIYTSLIFNLRYLIFDIPCSIFYNEWLIYALVVLKKLFEKKNDYWIFLNFFHINWQSITACTHNFLIWGSSGVSDGQGFFGTKNTAWQTKKKMLWQYPHFSFYDLCINF